VKHEQNRGYGAAIKTLFSRSLKLDADVLVTIDADGQHDPLEIPNILKPVLDGGADIVIGSRFVGTAIGSKEMPWYRRAGIKVITHMVNSSGKKVSDAQSGFRAYNRKALNELGILENGMGASAEILLQANGKGLIIAEVPCTCRYGNNGEIKTSTRNPVRHGASVVTSIVQLMVERRPLTTLGAPGIISLAIGIVFGVWMLNIYAITHAIVTNIALASMAFVLIGFFLISTAITLHAISRLADKVNVKKNKNYHD